MDERFWLLDVQLEITLAVEERGFAVDMQHVETMVCCKGE